MKVFRRGTILVPLAVGLFALSAPAWSAQWYEVCWNTRRHGFRCDYTNYSCEYLASAAPPGWLCRQVPHPLALGTSAAGAKPVVSKTSDGRYSLTYEGKSTPIISARMEQFLQKIRTNAQAKKSWNEEMEKELDAVVAADDGKPSAATLEVIQKDFAKR